MAADNPTPGHLAWLTSRLGSLSSKIFLGFGILIAVMMIHLGNEAYLKDATEYKPVDQQQYKQMQSQLEKLQAQQSAVLEQLDSITLAPEAAKAHQQALASVSTAPAKTGPLTQIFDILIVNDEMDVLELRLRQLYPIVDVFYVLESEFAFQGKAKPLYYKQNEKRFAEFQDKIVYNVIPPMTPEDEKYYYEELKHGAWSREIYARNKGLELSIKARRPKEGDWMIMSDLDEIPRRSLVSNLRQADLSTGLGRRLTEGRPEYSGDIIRIGCRYYHYSYEFKYDIEWHGPILTRFREPDSPEFTKEKPQYHVAHMKNMTLNDYKYTGSLIHSFRVEGFPVIPSQCHHCTWCFATVAQAVNKIESYSHFEYNTPEHKTTEWLVDRYSRGMDLFGREIYYQLVNNNTDIPETVAENPEKYQFMLRRAGLPNAGFVDVDPNTLKGK